MSATEWRTAWWSSELATFYQSPMWARAWAAYTGRSSRTSAWRAVMPDGRSAVLPAPSVAVLGGFARRYLLSPAGTYGGPFAESALSADSIYELVMRLRSRRSEGVWRWSPFAADGPCRSFGVAADETTRVLDLDAGEAALHRRWSKGHRAAARQAERLGVEIRLASVESDWDQYDEIYRESEKRWGETATSSYGPHLFRALREEGGDCVRLWLATVGGELAAGALCLNARRHVSYWHGAARERLFEYRPVHLMIEVILKDACDRGMRWLDFNPSGGHSGVEAFKKGFGAEALPAPVLRWEMPMLRSWRALRRAFGSRRRRSVSASVPSP